MAPEFEPNEHFRSPLLWHRFEAEKDLILSFAPKPLAGPYRYGVARITRAVETAEEESGEPIATILNAAKKHEALADLVCDALRYAQRTRVDAKIRSYGRVIARAYLATDDAEIDFARHIARTVDRLEDPHLTAIEIIARHSDAGEVDLEADSVEKSLTEALGPEPGRLATRQLANEGMLGGEGGTSEGGVFFGLSDYGRLVRAHLMAHAAG